MALRYNLIDLIPKGDSGESNQDSEPSVTINPANPSQLIAGAFAATGSTYYKSTNGGVAWVRFGTLPSDDKSLAWKADGSAVLTVSMVDTTTPNTFSTYSSNTTNSNFGAAINVFSGSDLDQPWIATGPDDRVYVTYNDLNKSGADAGGSGNGETASILVSTDGGNDYTSVTLDRVGTTYQDDPSVRVAVNGNTVYGVFVRWNSSVESDSNGDRYASQVVVVRSDNAGADGFTALGAGGNGVQVATPIDVFTDSGGSSLSVGEERIAAEVAITVDASDPNHVLVAYQDAPGADGSGQVQLVLAESTDGGVTWSTKFTTASSLRSGQPAIAVLADGAIGFLYDSYDPNTDELSQHFLTTTNDFATTDDATLATESNNDPASQYDPYLGDFFNLTSLGNTFYGTFCASNADNGTDAQFANLKLQRDFTGTTGTGSFQLTDQNGNSVPFSIDPYVFTCTLQPPVIAGLSGAAFTLFSSPVRLSAGLSLADAGSTTLASATVQVTGGTFSDDGDMLAADTSGTAISASYDSATETLTLMGADTVANYQTVLDGVTFSSTNADPTDAGNDDSRTIRWNVNDGSFSSSAQTSMVTLTPNPALPGGSTADMIMSRSSTGDYEIYDIGQNTILGAYQLTAVAAPWQEVGLGGFNDSDTTDMVLRNAGTGAFEIDDVSDNSVTGTAPLGQVGVEWQVAGFGDFSSRAGETDMLMRQTATGAFEVYDIANNVITFAAGMGQVGPEWTIAGFGDFSDNANETDMLMRNSVTGAFEVYDIADNVITFAAGMGQVGLEWTVAGFGDFSGNANETDMLMRNSATGVFELYDIANNTITFAGGVGQVGLEWTVAGFGNLSGNRNETDMLMRNSNSGAFEYYDITGSRIAGAGPMGEVGLEWQVDGLAADAPPNSSAAFSTAQLTHAAAAFGSASNALSGLPAASTVADALPQNLLGSPLA